MSHKKPLSHFPPVRIEIRPSLILKDEVGVFSTRPLKKDTIIVGADHFSDTEMILWKHFNKFDRVTRRKIISFCPANQEGFLTPPDLNYLSIAWHMNHSCKPNVGFNSKYDFVAMRNIKDGEELCWDYSYEETNPKFKMTCYCGQDTCRKKITGDDWKFLMKDKRKYAHFSPKLKAFIAKNKKNI